MTKVVLPANFTADELKHMREAGKILAGLYRDVRRKVKVEVEIGRASCRERV